MSSLDVGHLSEMQKNPLTKRQIIKTGTNSNSILVISMIFDVINR
jgi:hypothetical protein